MRGISLRRNIISLQFWPAPPYAAYRRFWAG